MSLSIKNLNKAFDNKIIFKDFSYEFLDTGIYILRGDSGSGKTTLLRIIAGLDNKFSGEISGGGIVNSSFAFQEYRLFPTLSAKDNVMIASKDENYKDSERAKDLLSMLGFTEDDMELKPDELSGGMKQRVAISRAILKPSPILLFDEPTKELDSALVSSLYEIIKKEAEKRLVIISTHENLPEDIFVRDTIFI